MTDQETIQKHSKNVLVPDSDIVASMVPELRTRLRTSLIERPDGLVVDLSNVRMIDSSGIGLLVAAHNSLSRSGKSLEIINVCPDVLGLFRSMRLDQHFIILGDGAEG